jgi:hypothetical protein
MIDLQKLKIYNKTLSLHDSTSAICWICNFKLSLILKHVVIAYARGVSKRQFIYFHPECFRQQAGDDYDFQ